MNCLQCGALFDFIVVFCVSVNECRKERFEKSVIIVFSCRKHRDFAIQPRMGQRGEKQQDLGSK